MTIKLIKASESDLINIESILKQNALEYEDVGSGNIDFFFAYNDHLLIGIIGLEKFDNIGLLRSILIKEEYRNMGYGLQICKYLILLAKNEKIEELYLLTCGAKGFFEKLGFKMFDRNSVPSILKQAPEFADLCPDYAICMKKVL